MNSIYRTNLTPTTGVEVACIGYALCGLSKCHSDKLPLSIKIVFDAQDLQSDFENQLKQEILDVLALIDYCDKFPDLCGE